MASYVVKYTEMKPGGHLERQCDRVRGDLESVREYFDNTTVFARDPITVIEFTESDGIGRVVPSSEWDI